MEKMISHKIKLGWLALLAAIIMIWPSLSEAVVPHIAYYRLTSGLTQPVHITHAGDGSGRIFVVEQTGRIMIIKNGALQTVPFLDITARVLLSPEQGLLSVAFPPLYASKHYFYVYYVDLTGNIRVSRFFITANPDVADPASEVSILTIAHPTFTNHYGGQLAFGPDGFLYLGTGDGGSGGDPNSNAQNTAALLGKLLRIDVESGAAPYAIPPGNPFFGSGGSRREIWAYGLRNPFRFSFDRLTGDLYIGDVGQNLFEEVDVQSSASGGGQNYGWNIMEGFSCFNSAAFTSPLPFCNTTGLTLPVFSYNHTLGDCAIIGGFVYRGQVVRSMQGLYFYGDPCTGRMWGLRNSGASWQNALLFDTALPFTSFGEDQPGQLYVASYVPGEIFKIGTPGIVTGDFNGDGRTDFAFLNVLGDVFYSTAPGVFVNVPGSLALIVAGNFNGTGTSGIAGLAIDGSVLISTDLLTFRQIPKTLTDLASGDFNGDGKADLAGIASDGSVWISTNLLSFTQITGNPSLSTLVVGDFNNDGRADLAGLTSDGSIYYTTNLTTWTNIPGTLTQLVSGHFNPLRPGDQLAGLALDGTVWLSTDLLTFQQIPGTFIQLATGDFNGDGTTDLAGLTSAGSISFTTDLTNYTGIAGPGFLTQMAVGNFNGISPADIVGITLDGSQWLTTDRATWTSIGPVRGMCHNPALKIGGTSAYYSTIQTAYNFATAGQSILIQAQDFVEDVSLTGLIPVTVKGGYACDYLTNTGFTTIHGSLTISGGTATVENLIVQ
jgi:glucose/arabinose dehydrogenase